MKRKAKQCGSRGRLRLGLLLATAAAFLLVPAGQALAAPLPSAMVIFAGEGSGSVISHEGPVQGNPRLQPCHWDGSIPEIDEGMTYVPVGEPSEPNTKVEEPGICKTELSENLVAPSIRLEHHADPGSVFAGWKVIQGSGLACVQESAGAGDCSVGSFGGVEVVVQATFDLEPLAPYALNLTASGAAGGEFECSINGGPAGPCPVEVEETKEVEVFATGTGVELDEWTTGPCAATNDNPCSFTMPSEAVSANAAFVVASEDLTINNEGVEGTVECQVNGGGFAPCSGTTAYTYGDEIDVTASAAAEHKLVSLVGTGDAEGAACEAASESNGSCSFTITEDSSVTATFEPAGTKAQVEGNVHGEVPVTTSLGSACSDVYLGEFLPGVAANYASTCTVTATSTGAATSLTASDESPNHTGHLVQGSYFLPDALETRANGGTYEGLETPVSLLTYSEPVSADNVNVSFRQHIGLHDGLHTGPYAKTITLTLEQTSP